ncbi:MAG: desulfoferrodoxin [Fusobacteriaceae bacterium]|jgi:superoxide reductase|nr:desulfoferrodoxin [Fusobacteriaceae bacterium]MBN2837258.1 desulfoferrodoxin [Fusobacteriaceae bacterium]
MSKIFKKDGILVELIAGETVLEGFEALEEKTADSSTEKHVPFIEETADGYLVKVGETTAHPMTPEHWIQFIELTVDNKVYKQYLEPTDKPEASFKVEKGAKVSAREYCNLHGLWKGAK